MNFRKVRIAWSVVWSVVAVLLCVLWMRSYWASDYFINYLYDFDITSDRGTVEFLLWEQTEIWKDLADEPSVLRSFPTDNSFDVPRQFQYSQFRDMFDGINTNIHLPHWFLLLMVSMIASVPWLRRRFSVRSLLIATTLVGVGLGTIIALSR
jgi:hypothetical protein